MSISSDALTDYEHHYKEELQLPLRVPPVVYTHVFARTIEGDKGDLFEMEFINEKSNKNNFLICVALLPLLTFNKYVLE